MTGTISTTITATYTLGSTPTTITPTGAVTATTGAALFGPATTAWYVANAGSLHANAGDGIALLLGGSVNNQTGAHIYGAYGGVSITGTAGALTNSGSITGGQATYATPGVVFADGGIITNATGGVIDGSAGILVSGAAGTVFNVGSINGAGANGVVLAAGGAVTNFSAGSIYGSNTAIRLEAPGTVDNIGVASAISRAVIMSGGLLDNEGTGILRAVSPSGDVVNMGTNGTVINAGIIQDVAAGTPVGILIHDGGTITNQASGFIEVNGDGVYAYGGISLINQGTIVSLGVLGGSGPTGVVGAGFMSNAAGATIAGRTGIYIPAPHYASIVNQGFIHGGKYAALNIQGSAAVSNVSGGTIYGYTDGVEGWLNTGIFVSNRGLITASGTAGIGVSLQSFGQVYNHAGATIRANQGVVIARGGTVTNGGTIAATGTADVIDFAPGYNNRLGLEAGATFVGKIDGGNTISAAHTSVLEPGLGSGTLYGLGSSVVNFGLIEFDAGGSWTIGGNIAGLASGQSIDGFALGDKLDLAGVTVTSSSFTTGTLALGTSGGTIDLLLPGSTYTTTQFRVAPSTDGTAITIACFARGTRILTTSGERAVEKLTVGDRVVCASGTIAPVVWLGHRRIDCRRHPRPREVWPVRIRPGAFGANTPCRELWLSPDHAVSINEVLVPVRHLLNDGSVAQVPVDHIEYWHVELAEHAELLAEGLPAESYLDTGNRAAFAQVCVQDTAAA